MSLSKVVHPVAKSCTRCSNPLSLSATSTCHVNITAYFITLTRSVSAAARLLRLWVRIPPGEWMSVCCECCVLSGRGLCDELITLPEESYRLWSIVVCDPETWRMRMPWPTGGLSRQKKKKRTNTIGDGQNSWRFLLRIFLYSPIPSFQIKALFSATCLQ